MFDRRRYLENRYRTAIQLADCSLNGSEPATDQLRSVCDFDQVQIRCIGSTQSSDYSIQYRRPQSTIRALAAPIPIRDYHSYRLEAATFAAEIQAIESQNYPGADYWRTNKEYIVDGGVRQLG